MRIRTQLFAGTALLVIGLVGIQWWLQNRQLQELDQQLAELAVQVGREIYVHDGWLLETSHPRPDKSGQGTPVKASPAAKEASIGATFITDQAFFYNTGSLSLKKGPPQATGHSAAGVSAPAAPDGEVAVTIARADSGKTATDRTKKNTRDEETVARIHITAEHENSVKYLIINGLPEGERRIPLPVAKTTEAIQATFRQSLLAGGGLLAIGLLGAALVANGLSRPVRELKTAAEALGQGRLGCQVKVGGARELRELLATFNHMSSRLAALEKEKEEWQAREHLAELGGLARGLAHTLRNPLHTLGLSVESLAARQNPPADQLVSSARGQIRRIDRWLKSFLAVGAAGDNPSPEPADLAVLVQELAFETVQTGHQILVEAPPEGMPAVVSPLAFRAALANLVENAVEASPPDMPVTIRLGREEGQVQVTVEDHGPGLPVTVRDRLFTPHLTTKPGGAGMGLYLSRYLIEALHHGKLTFHDRPEGGTCARIRLPEPVPSS